MKKNIEIIKEKKFKKILLSNDLEDLENEEKNDNSSLNLNNGSILNQKYNMNKVDDKKIMAISSEITNSEPTRYNENDNKQQKNEFISEKKNSKNIWIKKTKSIKNKLKSENKKKVYIRKKKSENINITENNTNNNENINTDINQIKIIEDNDQEQKEIIKEIKDSVICYICLMKIISPRICPNCHKIACEKCLKNWFIDKGNNNCGYCRAVLSFDKMVSIPIINDVANLIDKISSKRPSKKLGIKYTKSKNIKNNFKSISDISKEINNNNNLTEIVNNDNITRNSINIDNFSKFQNQNNEIYFDKKNAIISYSTHSPFINNMEKGKVEYCPKHPDQPLFYYCLNCDQAYCRTCFVFFGEEKDKHNNHSIIEYEKYKLINISKIKKISNNLDEKFEELEAYIKRCEALKNCYEFERKIVQNHVKQLMDDFNYKMDENIKILENIIKNYKFYLNQIEKGQNDIKKFYAKLGSLKSKVSEEELLDKISNICKIKYYNSKEVDGYSDLTKKISLNFYQTNLKKYEIKQNNYHFKLPLENSKYQLAITQKGNEVQIYIYWPLDKNKELSKQKNTKNKLVPFIFLRRKNRNWEHYLLDEFLTYKGNNYYIKRFPVNNFCNMNSYFKIKGLLYETLIE